MKFVHKIWGSFCHWAQVLLEDNEAKKTARIVASAFGMIVLTAILLEASGLA